MVYLRKLDEKVDRVMQKLDDHSIRLSQLELGQAGMRRDMARDAEAVALLGARLDRIDGRLDRIERRLGLIDI